MLKPPQLLQLTAGGSDLKLGGKNLCVGGRDAWSRRLLQAQRSEWFINTRCRDPIKGDVQIGT